MKRNTFPLTFLSVLILWGIYTKNMCAQGGRLWGTYYGGSDFDDIGLSWSAGKCIAGDAAGNVYIAAETSSPNNIAASGFLNVYTGGGWYEGFIAKFDAAGNRLWGTYYGAGFAKNTQATSVAVDNAGNVYVAGYTSNNANISFGGFQNAFAGANDAFLIKFDSNGNRLWATYYGGTGFDWGMCVTTDPLGNVYLAGTTESFAGIAAGGFLNAIPPGWGRDAFLVKFNSAGNRLWATYYGNVSDDYGQAVVTDAAGNVYLGGYTYAIAGIAAGGFQNAFGGGVSDAFLVKFNSVGNRLWATYYGGLGFEKGSELAMDPVGGNIYLTGYTTSDLGIASGGFQNANGSVGGLDAYLVKFDPAGNRLWATYYGGPAGDGGFGVSCDNTGNVFLSGWTSSLLGIASGGFQNIYGGGSSDAFIVKFDASGTRLCATYYGGTGDDRGFSMLTNTIGVVYLFGSTNGNNGISAGGFQNAYGGGYIDTFIAKFSTCTVVLTASIISSDAICHGACTGTATASSSGGTAPYSYLWNDGKITQAVTGLCAGTYTVTSTDAVNNTGTQTVTITQPGNALTAGVTTGTINCFGETTTAIASAGGGTPTYTYNWSAGVSGSGVQVSGLLAGNYTVTVTDNKGCASTSVTTIISPPPLIGQFTKGTANCAGCGCKEWLMVNATGGRSPYTYLWQDGYVNRYKNKLCPGTYPVNIADKNGCIVNININVP